jgi:hypothetical protein
LHATWTYFILSLATSEDKVDYMVFKFSHDGVQWCMMIPQFWMKKQTLFDKWVEAFNLEGHKIQASNSNWSMSNICFVQTCLSM